MGRISKWGN